VCHCRNVHTKIFAYELCCAFKKKKGRDMFSKSDATRGEKGRLPPQRRTLWQIRGGKGGKSLGKEKEGGEKAIVLLQPAWGRGVVARVAWESFNARRSKRKKLPSF